MSEDTAGLTNKEALSAAGYSEAEQELAKVRKALADANKEAKKYRETAESLQGRVSELESDDQVKGWKDRAIKAEVKAALKGQGVANPERVLKVLDLEGVDIDDSGKLTGLDEKVTATKTEWPELFDNKRRVGGGADIFASGEVKREMSGTEAQVARLPMFR